MPKLRKSVFQSLVPRDVNCFLTATLLLLAAASTFAQTGSADRRISARINDAARISVPGNVHPLALAQSDQGLQDPSSKLDRITMFFRMTATQQADLQNLLAQQQDRSSGNFHKWLTPEEYAGRFGVSQSDIETVAAWLRTQGFTVVETARSRNWIAFSGNVSQVQAAFRTETHRYSARGKAYFANADEPTVPDAFAGLILGFRGLNNYPVEAPRLVSGSSGNLMQPAFNSPQQAFTGGGSPVTLHYLAPDDLQTIYDLKPLYSSGINGTGQKIAIMGQTDIIPTDIARFRSLSGLPAAAPQTILVPGSTDPGVLPNDVQEASLDVEWSGATAPNATILYVYSTNVFASLEYAIGQDLAPVMSISYGNCEEVWTVAQINSFVMLSEQANAQGITIVAPSGDGGAADCDSHTNTIPAVQGLTVELPASLPYVTAVGGTEFLEGNGTYWNSTNDPSNGSALSYIPEITWHDFTGYPYYPSGGGGASKLFAKPSWQTGIGVPADGARDVPDVSLTASQAHDGYLVCVQSGCANGFAQSNGNFTVFGGTSFGAPIFAGMVALVNQKTNSTGQGNVNYVLYPLAASSSTAFHDITIGSNEEACVSGTVDCPYSGVGYNAGVGYDLTTGLGSVDAFNLASTWSSISVSAGSTPTLTSISPQVVIGGSADFTLTATGTGFASNGQILWNGSGVGVTMLPGGTSTSVTATISHNLVAFGTIAAVSVSNSSPTGGESAIQTVTVTGPPPSNDNFAKATALTALSTSTVDNSGATTESTDPTPPCVSRSTSPRTKTVWWSLTPTTTGTITIDTLGSAYDTVLSIWQGSPGNFTNVACNDDIVDGVQGQSRVTLSGGAGTTYYLMVSPFGPPDSLFNQFGGKTVVNVSSVTTLTYLTVSPTTVSVKAGGTANFQLKNSSTWGITLKCTGLPPLATCGPSTVANSSTITFSISTTAASGTSPNSLDNPRSNSNFRPAVVLLIACVLSMPMALRQSRAVRPLTRVAFMLAVIFLLVECGGGGGSNAGGSGAGGTGAGGTSSPGTPAGTYTITLTGTAPGSSINQSLSVTLQVN